MDQITETIEAIAALPIYNYGWLVFAILAFIPALVSGNMTQHLATQLLKREIDPARAIKPLLANLVLFVICLAVLVYALIQLSEQYK